LNKGSLKETGIDDVKDFKMLDNAMDAVGLTMADKSNIYRIAAAVLHLGNITFQESTKDKKGKIKSYFLYFIVLCYHESFFSVWSFIFILLKGKKKFLCHL